MAGRQVRPKDPRRLPSPGSRLRKIYDEMMGEGANTLTHSLNHINAALHDLENYYLFDIRAFPRPKTGNSRAYKVYRIVGREIDGVYHDFIAGMKEAQS